MKTAGIFEKIQILIFWRFSKKHQILIIFFWKSPKNIFSRKSPKNQNFRFSKIHQKITVLRAAIQCSNKSRTQITHYNHTPRLCFLIWRFIFSKESSWFHAGIESASQSCKDSTVLPIGRGWNVVRLMFMLTGFSTLKIHSPTGLRIQLKLIARCKNFRQNIISDLWMKTAIPKRNICASNCRFHS